MSSHTQPPSSLAAHPWHGIAPELDGEGNVTVFIEIVAGQNLKFELDKPSGWLKIDRPQQFASRPPAMYGLIPRTYCGERVGARCMEVTGLHDIVGDGDPMDVVLLSEFNPAFGGLIARVRVIGGLRMIDRGEADDKIITVLAGDSVYGRLRDVRDVPRPTLDRLRQYFLSYKQGPDDEAPKVSIAEVYDRAEALQMICRSEQDYAAHFGG